jgi:hypothetical protein
VMASVSKGVESSSTTSPLLANSDMSFDKSR